MQETTAFIHSIPVDPLTGAISVPIYQTSTFVQEAPGIHKGYDYARSNNPTRAVFENLVAVMEKGARGLAFAERAEVGWVNINASTNLWESHLAFGGRAGSASGIGRVGGTSTQEAFTEAKTVTFVMEQP